MGGWEAESRQAGVALVDTTNLFDMHLISRGQVIVVLAGMGEKKFRIRECRS
jgi:hypothetical protein